MRSDDGERDAEEDEVVDLRADRAHPDDVAGRVRERGGEPDDRAARYVANEEPQ